MKYAIPVNQGQLSLHFGQSTEFMLISTDAQGRIISKETISTVAHNCGWLPKVLSGHGVNMVLAGGMGCTPRMIFERNNIEVVLGVSESDPEKAVISHVQGSLVSGPNVCSHGDTACDHSHG